MMKNGEPMFPEWNGSIIAMNSSFKHLNRKQNESNLMLCV
jgi:hypothetical protein